MDDIIRSIPVNKTAALVTSKGVSFDVKDRINIKRWDACPRLEMFKGPTNHDLTGTKYGRLTVIGYYGHSNSCKSSQWVVRCDCGAYEIRNAKRIRKSDKGKIYTCMECQNIATMKRRHEFDVKGFNASDEMSDYY